MDEFPSMHPPRTVGTEYHGPVAVSVFQFGGRAIRMVRPADPDRLLDESKVHDWNRRDDYMPYWAYLWPAAYLLAEAVVREDWPKTVEALEIGCGLGLAGLTGLACGLRVQFSDYDPAPLEFVTRSAAENGFDASRFTTRLAGLAQPARRDVSGHPRCRCDLRGPVGPPGGRCARQDVGPRRSRPDRQPVPRVRGGVSRGC